MDISKSVELFDRVNQQDFEACELTQPSMSSKAYTRGGALVPSEHHIEEFHQWWNETMGYQSQTASAETSASRQTDLISTDE